MERQLLVFGEKTFRVTVPDGAKVTFSPWSPPNSKGYHSIEGGARGTLRIYKGSKDNIIACFSGVTGFRDMTLPYAEQVAKEEGSTIWKDDAKGYVREHKVSRTQEWEDEFIALEAPKRKRK